MNALPTTRRAFLGRVAAITGAAIAASLPASQLLVSPAYAADKDPTPAKVREAVRRAQERNRQVLTGKKSLNRWEMERVADDGGSIYTRPVPGTPLKGIAVRMGHVETVLVHVVRRFHYEIDELRRGDVVGWRSPGKVGKALAESNQASGTAVQIRPEFYPAGSKGGFFAPQLVVIRDILAELEGVVRWGGDDSRADESLFSIDVGPGDPALARVSEKIRIWHNTPGQGAGTAVDTLSSRRQKAAKTLERRQRQAA